MIEHDLVHQLPLFAIDEISEIEDPEDEEELAIRELNEAGVISDAEQYFQRHNNEEEEKHLEIPAGDSRDEQRPSVVPFDVSDSAFSSYSNEEQENHPVHQNQIDFEIQEEEEVRHVIAELNHINLSP